MNVVAVLYQARDGVNLAWPRAAVYDLTGHTWWLQWSAVLFIGATLVGAAYLAVLRLHAKIDLPHVPHTAAIDNLVPDAV